MCSILKAEFILEEMGKDLSVMYQTTFVGLYCCEMWKLIVAHQAQLLRVEHHMMMCGVKLVDRLSTDVLRDRKVF